MKNIYVLAPNDRFNYGDLLFPYIIKHYFKDCCDEMVFCSTTESDLSDFGGISTKSHTALYEANATDSNHLIVAGGDSLCIEWPLIMSFIDRSFSRIDYLIRIGFLNKIVKKMLLRSKYNVKTKFPYTIGKNELTNFKGIYYNSLGGSYLMHHLELLDKKSTIDILDSADYLSVRDSSTLELLQEHKVDSKLVADSAILMSDVFDEDFLFSKISTKLPKPSSKFIYFQINIANCVNNDKQYANMLSNIHKDTGLNIILCPIGTALGHSDQDALLKIKNHLGPDPSFRLIKKPSIWDIMWLIKHSCLYIGSSLHGNITAMSFGIPFAVYGPNKLKTYLDSWGGSQFFASNVSRLQSIISDVLKNPIYFNATNQKITVQNSFRTISELIDKADLL